jgi:beta-lactamase regulating signal transducer with metallopeptidase domain
MLQLFESGFLLSLGKAIAASIWQMGILFLIYQVIVSAFRIKQSAAKNVLSSIFSIGGFLWFTITFLIYSFQKSENAIVIEEGNNSNSLIQTLSGSNNWQLLLNWAEYKLNLLLPYLSVAYLFVLLWFSARLLFQVQAAQQLKNKGLRPVKDNLKEFTSFLASSLGISKNILVYFSTKIDIPATIGFLKPVILLPATAVTHLTHAQLEAVLLHELAHIRRNDYFWNLLLSISETLLFFNPFALLLINIARKERENSCDDVVMSYQQNAAVYAEALLNVEKARLQTPALAMALGDNKHHLMHRVKRILNLPVEKNRISTRLLALLFFTVVFALMGWVLETKKQEQLQLQEKKIAVETKAPKEVLYFSPDELVKKENKIVLRDASQKISLNIRKNLKEEKIFIVRNDDGEEFTFDNLVIEDFPKDWLPGFAPHPQTRVRTTSPEQYQEMKLMYINDSILKLQKEREELYRNNLAHGNIRMRMPQTPMSFYFNNQPFRHIDTMMEEMYQQPPHSNFEWKGEMPFVMMHERDAQHDKDWSDKMKQVQKKSRQSIEVMRKRIAGPDIKKIKLVDSILEHTIHLRSFPQEWLAVIEPVKEELSKEHPKLMIIIENNQITINGKQIQIDSSSVHPQTIPAASKKMMKMVEIMRL